MRVFAFLSALTVVSAAFCATSAEAAIALQIQYVIDSSGPLGTTQLDGRLEFVLNGKDVLVYDLSGGGRTLIASRSSGQGFFFGPARFSVGLHRNSIDLTGVYSSHVIHAHVVTDGSSSCQATVTNRLKPGNRVFHYVYPGIGPVDVYSTSIHNVSCSFSRG